MLSHNMHYRSEVSGRYGDAAVLDDYDTVYGEEEPADEGEAYVNFAEDAVSDQQTETDIKQLEGKHKMSLQQMKEHVLASVSCQTWLASVKSQS